MTIRKATIEDKDQLVQRMDEFNQYYYDGKIFSEEYVPFWEYKDKSKTFQEAAEGWLTTSDYFVYVADEEDIIVGYIVGHVKDRTPRVLDKEGYIDDWFVTKDLRHTGIGMQLYQVLVDIFKKQECNRLGLLTNIGNKQTIEFYHKLGFIDESVSMVKRLV